MEVANPIYDVVFKYLMQNQRVAHLLIGRITGLAVQSLTVSPQETSVHRTPDAPDHDLPLTLLRMDFAARVRTEDGGLRQVLIEIQKAKAPTVIERFRLYLGQQISSRDMRNRCGGRSLRKTPPGIVCSARVTESSSTRQERTPRRRRRQHGGSTAAARR